MTRSHKIIFAMMAAASVWLLFLIFFGNNGVLELHRKHQDLNQMVGANQQLSRKNIEMYRIVGRLHSDPDYIEHVARKELGMVRSDEFIFTFAADMESQQP